MCELFLMHMLKCVRQCHWDPTNQAPSDGTAWHIQGCEGMRHMLCVGLSIHVFGLRHSNRTEPSDSDVAYIQYVTFGGFALLGVLYERGK